MAEDRETGKHNPQCTSTKIRFKTLQRFCQNLWRYPEIIRSPALADQTKAGGQVVGEAPHKIFLPICFPQLNGDHEDKERKSTGQKPRQSWLSEYGRLIAYCKVVHALEVFSQLTRRLIHIQF